MSKFKIGDEVICIPGFESESNGKGTKYGGASYSPEYKFIVHRITDTSNQGNVAWESGRYVGVYVKALKLISDEPNYEIY